MWSPESNALSERNTLHRKIPNGATVRTKKILDYTLQKFQNMCFYSRNF
jgi:hypothetical protein